MISTKNFKILREEKLPRVHSLSDGIVRILYDDNAKKYYIQRVVVRNNVKNLVSQYEFVKNDGIIVLRDLDEEICTKIVKRILSTKLSYNSCFILNENDDLANQNTINWIKSDQEHKFTSTGIKFWRHQQQMFEFKRDFDGAPKRTVISTHISPEGACNLKCPYCSVTYRDTHSRIPLQRIKNYVEDLITRGLKAVILTGGGEPTLYPQFNELVLWLKKDKGLSVALITNGTTKNKILPDALKCFSWIRVSINIFEGWEEKISLNVQNLSEDCITGCSFVYTSEHEATNSATLERIDLLNKVSKIADKCNAKYIRLLPNCLLEQEQLIQQHISLKKFLENVEDKRFFQQYKVHNSPRPDACHQAYFRPYLSEETYQDGTPGTVYPCDSVVLNDTLTHFASKYQICKPEEVLDFLDGNLKMKFNPSVDCPGCVFTDNVNMLDDWKMGKINKFDEFQERLIHEEFV